MLSVNYRGSPSFGEDLFNSLLGNIGENDVNDCGNLTKLALERFKDLIDTDRVGVFGNSHGGFNAAWLTGHPDYKDIFKAAVLNNPVLNLSCMYASTDVPDWVYANALN